MRSSSPCYIEMLVQRTVSRMPVERRVRQLASLFKMRGLTSASANLRTQGMFVAHGWLGRVQTLHDVSVIRLCSLVIKGMRVS